jgi:hypothetical protein
LDLIAVFQILRRRWGVVAGALLLTLVTAVLLARADTATYASQGAAVVVRGPGAPAVAGTGSADPALQQTARLLAEVATSSAAVRGLDDPADVVTTVDPELPILSIQAVGDDAPSAENTAQATVEGLEALLDEFRATGGARVPDNSEIRQLVAPTAGEVGEADDGSLEYTSEATLLLARAGEGDDQTGLSGIIVPSQDEQFVAGVVFERLSDDGVRREMLERGASGDFELELDESNPLIRVEATSGDPDEALATGQIVVETMQQVAVDIQANDEIPEDLRFRVEALSYPLAPFVLDSATLRTVLAVIALGLLATVGLALMVDAAATRREEHPRPSRQNEGDFWPPWKDESTSDRAPEPDRPTVPREL